LELEIPAYEYIPNNNYCVDLKEKTHSGLLIIFSRHAEDSQGIPKEDNREFDSEEI
jgi:hypothetical protein